RALQLRAELGFLAIHVIADGAAGERADARTDERALATLLRIVASEGTHGRASECADASTLGGLADLLLARVGVCRHAAGKQHGGHAGGRCGNQTTREAPATKRFKVSHVILLDKQDAHATRAFPEEK